MKTLFTSIALLFCLSASAQNYVDGVGPIIWLNAGYGFYSNPNNGSKIDIDVVVKKNIFTASCSDHTPFSLLESEEQEGKQYYSILYGKCYKNRYFLSSISVGPSLAEVTYIDSVTPNTLFHPNVYSHTVYYAGIAFKVQTILYVRRVGIGFSLEANLNSVRSFIGLGLNLSLGLL